MYPDWVIAQKKKGQTIKKVGNNYYLYARTSKYVKGAKYPKTVDTYLGVITPEGVIPPKTKKVSTDNGVSVREYGYSNALEQLAPQAWKYKMGDDWRNVLANIVLAKSPATYLKDEPGFTPLDPEKITSSRSTLIKDLRDINVKYSDLDPLLYVYIVKVGKKKSIAFLSEEQKVLLRRLRVELKV